jgi:hypothetical protein
MNFSIDNLPNNLNKFLLNYGEYYDKGVHSNDSNITYPGYKKTKAKFEEKGFYVDIVPFYIGNMESVLTIMIEKEGQNILNWRLQMKEKEETCLAT